jgi:hypothetical protein
LSYRAKIFKSEIVRQFKDLFDDISFEKTFDKNQFVGYAQKMTSEKHEKHSK